MASSFTQLPAVGAMTNPMTTGGDTIYGGASGLPTRLNNGSSGQVLTSGGTTVPPTWATPGAPALIGVRVFQNAGTSMPNGTLAVIAFQTETFDTNTFHDNVTNNSRITFLTAGIYVFGGSLTHVTAGNDLTIFIRLNGSTNLLTSTSDTTTGTLAAATTGAVASGVYQFAANDYIEMTGAGNGTNNSSGDTRTSFWAYKIG